jgi:hypothetical protein
VCYQLIIRSNLYFITSIEQASSTTKHSESSDLLHNRPNDDINPSVYWKVPYKLFFSRELYFAN